MAGLLAGARSLWRTLRGRREFESEMEEEFRFHLERRAQDLEAAGLSAVEARRRARLEFGSEERYREEGRASRGVRLVDELHGDVRYAVRSLRRSPGFAVAATLTLALGIGANTAIFSVVDAVLFRALPYPESDRLVSVWPEGSFPRGGIDVLEARSRAYETLSAHSNPTPYSLTGEGEPERLVGTEVTPDVFATLGVNAARGRTLVAGEEERGRGAVVVLSHRLWQRRFDSDPSIVGRTIRLDGIAREVVGIMPRGFAFPGADVELWVPVTFDRSVPAEHWGSYWMRVVGRLRDGTTVEQANAELRSELLPQVRDGFPFHMPDDWAAAATVAPLHTAFVGDFRPMLLVLLGAVGLVLLVACVNVANLLIARASARRKELAVRAALGAGRGRIIRQLLTESLVLSAVGGALGVAVALAAGPSLLALLPAELPRADEIALDARVLAYAAAAALGTGLLFGMAPALRLSRSRVQDSLKEGRGAGESRGRRRLASALVAAEIALAVLLVIGAGLLMRSLWNMLHEDPGFSADNLVTAVVAPPEFRYGDDEARRIFYGKLLQRLRGLPGTTAVAAASGAPFSGGVFTSVFTIEGAPPPGTGGAEWPLADHRIAIGTGWFRALDIPILAGRDFTAADRAGALPVAILSRTLAERYWPGEDPVGRRIAFPASRQPITIVGIVADARWHELTEAHGGSLFLPIAQAGTAGPMRILLRTASRPDAAAARLRAVVAELDRDTPISDIRSMQDAIAQSMAGSRATMLLLSLFAALALALGAIGIYGVTAYTVSRRGREIGIRMALGARRADVLRMILAHGAALAAIGIATGLLSGLAASRLLAGLLFGVQPHDPAVLLAVAGLVTGVALAASLIPALRATRIDPIASVRSE